MKRRETILALLALGAAPIVAFAQQSSRVYQIGFLGPPLSIEPRFFDAFREGLQKLGYFEGKNIAIDYRGTTGVSGQALRDIASEVVARKVDVIVASVAEKALAARSVTSTIPIVIVNVPDPIEAGLVESLGRPGGNVTGLSRNTVELIGKTLGLLAEAVPHARLIGILSNPADPSQSHALVTIKQLADSRGLRLYVANATTATELEGAMAAMRKERVEALLVLQNGFFYINRTKIVELAQQYRLPSMGQDSEFADAGGLLAYSSDSVETYRIAATYVDRILRGAKPTDLPIQQPTKFEFAINVETAKTLGIKIPQSILVRADRVIE